jgi:serine phosphatase RsbU (regulator of sigma subunit)
MRRRLDAPGRAGRAAFTAGAAASLYAAAAYGALAAKGHQVPEAALLSAGAGVAVAAILGWLVWASESRERRRRILEARGASPAERGSRAAETSVPGAPPRFGRPEAAAAPRLPSPTESRDERLGREIQASLLPRDPPSLAGYHVEVSYHPCGALGGDFYDFRVRSDGRLLLTLGDVSGKGAPGAIVMAMVQTLFRQHAETASGPAELLDRVNEGFEGAVGKGIFVTALAALLDPERHTLAVAGAGHHPVLLLNPRERRSTLVSARGMALGLARGARFREALGETTIDLAPGDALLLYTDGAVDGEEALAAGGGEHRLRAAAAAAVLEGARGALARMGRDLGTDGARRDDTTLLLVARTGGEELSRPAAELRVSGRR